MRRMKPFLALMLVLLAGFQMHSAWAHSRLQSLEAVRSRNATRLSVRFSSPVDVPFCRFSLVAEGTGRPVTLLLPDRVKRASALVLTASRLPPGAYVFTYSILSVDGYRQRDRRHLTLE